MLGRFEAAGKADGRASARLDCYVGDKIRQHRAYRGMLPIDLARTLGIEERAIVEFELGLVKVDTLMLHRIADALDVRLSALYGFT